MCGDEFISSEQRTGGDSRGTPLDRLMQGPVNGETTLIVQHIPKTFEQLSLMKVFADIGFKRSINLLHVPCDCRKKLNLGFCMVNLATSEAARLFQNKVHGMRLESLKGSKTLRTVVSRTQGFAPNLAQLQKSLAVLEGGRAPDNLPLIVDTDAGKLIPFPLIGQSTRTRTGRSFQRGRQSARNVRRIVHK